MSSQALASLLTGLDEVEALRVHYPVRGRLIPTGIGALAEKAHGRACVVLLSSHLERYIYASNEEAIELLNLCGSPLNLLPQTFLLLQSREAVDELAKTSWENRGPKLASFSADHAPLWATGATTGSLSASQNLVWMKTPNPRSIVRYYASYGIPDIFDGITRRTHTRAELRLALTELVEKRNQIAHGDSTSQALPSDVARYLRAVRKFATSADRVLGRALSRRSGGMATW